MPDTTITGLNTGAATSSHVVAADNGAGTATHKIALGSIAGVGAPQAHAASHLPTGTDPINVLAQHIPTVISAGPTIADDLLSLEGDLAATIASVAAFPGSFGTASINPLKIRYAQNPSAVTLMQEIADINSFSQSLEIGLSTANDLIATRAQTESVSWAPSIRLSNNTAPDGVTYTSSATAIRIGDLVFLDGQIAFSAYPATIPAGTVWISGLPYAVETALHGVVFNAAYFVTANHLTTLYAPAALPRMKMQMRVPTILAGGGGTADLTFGILNTNSSFRFQAFYKTNSPW